jgi:hypothetical protein
MSVSAATGETRGARYSVNMLLGQSCRSFFKGLQAEAENELQDCKVGLLHALNTCISWGVHKCYL